MRMLDARVNKIDCKLFYDERISPKEAPDGFPFIYYLRHGDCNWIEPSSIETFVFANFFGTIFTEKPFSFNEDNIIIITDFWM